MKINMDSNSKSDCYNFNHLTKFRPEKRCTKKCRDRAVLYLSLTGIAFLLAFVLGYYFSSSLIRVVWLFISVTLLILTCISVVVVTQFTKNAIDDRSLSEEKDSKKYRIRNRIIVLLSIVLVLLLPTGCLKEENLNIPYRGYGPEMKGDSWVISEPEMENMDKNVIELVYRDFYNESKYPTIQSLLIVRNGKLVAEGYCKDTDDIENIHNIKSATKSVTSILTGIMLDNGYLDSISASLYDYLPQYFSNNDQKRDITLRHVLTMETGLEFDNDIHTREMLYYRGSSLKFVLDRDLVFEPGTGFYYGDGNPQLLSGLIFEITGKTESEFAKEYLFGPLGISNYIWESTYDGLSLGAIGLWLTPRDMAKIGVLMANNGLWNGVQVVSETWVKESTRDQSSFSNYGYYWYPIENKAFYAEGHGGQLIWVYPDFDLVVVITSDPYAKSWNLSAPYTDIFSGIIASLKDRN